MGSIDVRNDSDIAGFESLLSKGPLTLVYVHADFCGHCKTFSDNVWKNANKENTNVNTASVHYDMVDKTSIYTDGFEGGVYVVRLKNSGMLVYRKVVKIN